MTAKRGNSANGRRFAIIGAGPGGLCTAIRLKQAGLENFVIFERGSAVGGTWWNNRYPGAACDVPSHLYSFSFEIKTDWSRPYSTQPEIQAYFEHCAEKYAITPHIRFSTAIASARWDDERALWQLTTEHGDSDEAHVVVSAMGMFNEPYPPKIPGLDAFAGTTFPSARWNHRHDLDAEKVAVIGSAASATQFVPEVAKRTSQLSVFQRSANWVLPKEDDPYTPDQIETFTTEPSVREALRQEIYQNIERLITYSSQQTLQKAEAAGLANLETIRDPEVRRKLTPTHPYGCKRPLLSNEYYPTFNRPDVELVTEPIARIHPDAIETDDGKRRAVDTIILGTGFETTRYLSAIEVAGRDGVDIEAAWADGAQAYFGITTSGFPNLFMLYGPNTNNGSILFMLECQVDYVMRQIARLSSEELAWLDVRPDVMDRYNEDLQHDIGQVGVWQASCNGYYRGPGGRIITQWPHTTAEYRARTQRADDDAYETKVA